MHWYFAQQFLLDKNNATQDAWPEERHTMYQYDQHDKTLVAERVRQFANQTQRYLAGELSEEQFLPLRLQNGLYVQRHAPMLRIAVPYGMISAAQLRKIADITETYDKGYAHLTTRQNIQLNWPALEQVPDILAELASVEMHAIQTSGNCIRNTTTDQFAGVAEDEIEDPRPWCEIIRQWSTFHPEFAFLPRKFKIAVNGAKEDRAAIQAHDIGLELVRNADAELGFRVLVGGGLGRTPMLGTEITPFLPWQHLLTYLDAILRTYNRFGRRDNKYKARIKILVKALGIEAFRQRVEDEWKNLKDGSGTLTEQALTQVSRHFIDPDYETEPASAADLDQKRADSKAFDHWVKRNASGHKYPGYATVTLSLKSTAYAPGDINTEQLRIAANLAETYSFGELRISHQQNLILPDVKKSSLFSLWQALSNAGFATPNLGLLTDVICCPGGDYCALANAKSLPVAEAIQRRFDDIDYLYDLGDLDLNISGCMNACGHHHIGNIGILGVDKKGEEYYQIQIGGASGNDASLGKIIGPSFSRQDVPDVLERLLNVYVEQRFEGETFIATSRRIGLEPFKERAYAKKDH